MEETQGGFCIFSLDLFPFLLSLAAATTTGNDGDDDGAELTMEVSATTMGVGGRIEGAGMRSAQVDRPATALKKEP